MTDASLIITARTLGVDNVARLCSLVERYGDEKVFQVIMKHKGLYLPAIEELEKND